MKLNEAIIRRLDTRLKNLLAIRMNKSVFTVIRWIKENEENGPLTTKASLEVIGAETGISEDKILNRESLMGEQK